MSKSTVPASALPTDLPFIVSSTTNQVDHATRKLIRSHVMRGKNKKGGGRPLLPPNFGVTSPASRARVDLEEIITCYSSLPPERFGTRPQFTNFPKDVDPQIFLKMEQVSRVAMPILFPLLFEIGFQPGRIPWTHPSEWDPVALYIDAFATQTFIDRVLRNLPQSEVNPVATRHLQKGLQLLRERLQGPDHEAKISDATITIVLDLATAALFHGDSETAKKHIFGLGKMTDLRGGLQALKGNPALLVEILRCDMSIALTTETHPVFCCRVGAPVPKIPDQVICSFDSGAPHPKMSNFHDSLNVELADLWLVTMKFCLLVNLATQTRRRFHASIIYETMTPIMYRLLHMNFATQSIRDESIRLGLLVFAQHIFLQGQQIRLPCPPLSQAYRLHLRACDAQFITPELPSQVTVWLLMVGAISLFSVSEEVWLGEGLRKWIQRSGVSSWKDLQAVLKSCMWISVLDDQMGQQVFDSLSCKP